MAKNARVLRRSLIATGIVLMAGTVWGQSSETEMRVFPMPPSQGFKADKAFGFVGDYGYFESGSQPTATPSFQGLPSAQDYDYFRYTGFEGKNVYIYGAWGRNPHRPANCQW
jgi:hypothetical protein